MILYFKYYTKTPRNYAQNIKRYVNNIKCGERILQIGS